LDFGLCGSEILSCGGVWISLGSRKRERERAREREREMKRRAAKTGKERECVCERNNAGSGQKTDKFHMRILFMGSAREAEGLGATHFSAKVRKCSHRCYRSTSKSLSFHEKVR